MRRRRTTRATSADRARCTTLADSKRSSRTSDSPSCVAPSDMSGRGPGFVVLYRWRLHPGAEESFAEAWSRVTELLRSERGSLGSRLHRGSDGLWYGYAQWPSAAAREQAFAGPSVDADAGRR